MFIFYVFIIVMVIWKEGFFFILNHTAKNTLFGIRIYFHQVKVQGILLGVDLLHHHYRTVPHNCTVLLLLHCPIQHTTVQLCHYHTVPYNNTSIQFYHYHTVPHNNTTIQVYHYHTVPHNNTTVQLYHYHTVPHNYTIVQIYHYHTVPHNYTTVLARTNTMVPSTTEPIHMFMPIIHAATTKQAGKSVRTQEFYVDLFYLKRAST